MDSPAAIIRVKALQPQRRRAGMLFTREPRELTPADFGEGLVAGEALLALVSDPQLVVTGIDAEGGEHSVTVEMVAELEAFIAADREARQAEFNALLEKAAIDAAAGPTEPDTAGPQDDGSTPAVEAPQAGGPEATADASDGSAAAAGTTEAAPPAKPSGRAKGKSDKPAESGG